MVNGMNLKLKRENILIKEPTLTPEKELEYRNTIAVFEKRTTDLETKVVRSAVPKWQL